MMEVSTGTSTLSLLTYTILVPPAILKRAKSQPNIMVENFRAVMSVKVEEM
jgi:hypothetical protein